MLAFGLGFIPAMAWAEIMVVVVSNAPFAREGMAIDRDHKITLEVGQQVVFLTESGRILEVTGPHSGRVKGRGRPAPPSIMRKLQALIMKTGGGEADLGGVRGDPSAGKPEDLIIAPDTTIPGTAVEVMRGGTWCMINSSPPELLRPTFQRAADAKVINQETEEQGTTSWGSWQTRTKWPEGLSIYDGATYSVSVDGAPPATFTLRLIPEDMADPIERLNWMAAAGCETQVKTAIHEIQGKL